MSTTYLRRFVLLALAAGALCLVAAGCGDDDGESCGVAGMTVACACPGGGMGAQECLADGTFGACDCGGGGIDGGAEDAGADDAGAVDGGSSDSGTTPGCGDDVCQADEDPTSCEDDCDAECGDGFCDTGETAEGCAADCVCDPFGSSSSCDAAASCTPVGVADDGVTLEGACLRTGTLAEGADCTPAEREPCGPGLACVLGECRQFCDYLAADGTTGACPSSDELCFNSPDLLLYGACGASCTAFASGECPSGEWCHAGLNPSGEGVCRTVGSGAAGDACVQDIDCGMMLTCNEGECQPLCNPDGGSGCASGEGCRPNPAFTESGIVDGQTGECLLECTFGSTGECPSGESCVAAELVGWTSDICRETPGLSPGDVCDFPERERDSVCYELGTCVYNTVEDRHECVTICRLSEGGYGTGHPDCASGEECMDLGATTHGVCIAGS